jgi:rhamnose transport system ATP-binding protein
VFLGNSMASRGWLDEAGMRRRYEELCGRLGLDPARARRAGDLSVAEQQMLEIARALVSDATAVMFDEPTASLAHAERTALFATMAQLRHDGLALTLVTHNLDDVLEHADVVTVFRDGGVVETRPTVDWTKKSMVAAMLGRAVEVSGALTGQRSDRADRRVDRSAPVLEVRGLCSGPVRDVDLSLAAGEVLGIAGLVGSGRSSLLRALAGLDPATSGTVRTSTATSVDRPPRTVREARRRGVTLLPEDRKGQGLVLSRSGAENVTLGEWRGLSRLGWLRGRQVDAAAARAAGPVGFRPERIGERALGLSGGNQQKLMLARWLLADHPVLLADEPTRGVDVGAKAEILAALEDLVAAGRSLVLVSSELEEVIGVSDRVLVMHGGMCLAMLDNSAGDVTVSQILSLIFDAADDSEQTGSAA